MDPAVTLLLLLAALHVLEGLYWVRREAIAFVRTWRSHRFARTGGPFGNSTHALLLLSPFPPLFETYVVEPWPITITPEAVWNLPAETLGSPDAPPREALRLVPSELLRVRADGREVWANGRRFVRASSGVAALQIAALLRELGESSAKSKRKKTCTQVMAQRFDVEAVKARVERFLRVSWRLDLYGNLLPWVLIGGAYLFFFVPALGDRWIVLAGLCGVLLLASWIELYIGHRRLYPQLRGERWMRLVMVVFSFPAAAHARAWLARDALAEFHPLAVARALLRADAFEKFASEAWRDLNHPLGPAPEAARADLALARADLLAAFEQQLTEAGLTVAELEAPPERDGDGVLAFCPRCHAQYTEAEGPCSDCPGVMRSPFAVEPEAARTAS